MKKSKYTNSSLNYNSKFGKTDYAKWTSMMRKLDNELEKDRISEKRFIREKNNDETENI